MSDFFQDWQKKSLGKVLLARLRAWWKGLAKPDPWPEEMDREVRTREAFPVCHRCFLPLEYEKNRWFCSDCGAAVGPYNNILPFIRIFSLGEVMRSGVGPEAPLTTFTICGYILVSYTQFWLVFPFYVFRLCRNILRKKKSARTEGNDGDEKNYGRLLGVALALSALLFTVTGFTLWPLVVKTKVVAVKPDNLRPSEFPRRDSSPLLSGAPTNTTPIDIRFRPPIVEPSATLPTQRFYRVGH